jgi:hypothetical protein
MGRYTVLPPLVSNLTEPWRGQGYIGGADGSQPHIAHTWLPRVIPPRLLALKQVVSFALSPVGQGKNVGGFALHKALLSHLKEQVSSAPCTSHTSCFPLLGLCGTNGLRSYPHFLLCLLQALEAGGGTYDV